MKQPVHARPEHPAPKIINLIGPTLIIASAAILFMSDFAFKMTLGVHFGVSPAVIDPSLQTSMAEGFYTLIGGNLIIIKTILIWRNLLIVIGCFAFAIAIGIGLYRSFGKQKSLYLIGIIQTANIRIITLSIIITAILLGAASGDLFAKSLLKPMDATIASGCRHCLEYRTNIGSFAGIMLFEDKQRVVLAQKHGVRTLKVDDVLAIVRVP